MKQSRNTVLEVLVALLLFAGVSLVSARMQRPTAVHDGKGWDGILYYSVADQFHQGKKPHEIAPFVYRLGTPFLASLLDPENITQGFRIANIIAAGLLTVLLVIWLRMHIESWGIRLILIGLFLLQWHGPTRFVYYYPDTADPWALVFFLAGLICINKLRIRYSPGMFALLCVICFVGVLFREIVGVVGLAAVFTSNLLSFEKKLAIRKPEMRWFIPLGCSVLGVLSTRFLATRIPGDYSFVLQIGDWLYNQALVMYLHAWLIAYGPIIFLLIFGWRLVYQFMWENQYLLAYMAGIVGLSWIGGADTERFAFWAMPVIYVLIGKVIAQKSMVLQSALLIAFLAINQAISERVFWTIPDEWGGKSPSFVYLTPIRDVSNLNLYSHYGAGRSLKLSLLEFCFIGFVLLVWLFYRQKKLRSGGNAGVSLT